MAAGSLKRLKIVQVLTLSGWYLFKLFISEVPGSDSSGSFVPCQCRAANTSHSLTGVDRGLLLRVQTPSVLWIADFESEDLHAWVEFSSLPLDLLYE